MTWITTDNKIIASLEDMPEGVFGICYLIENHTKNKSYIGKKQVISVTKKKFGKRKLAEMTDKRAKKYEMVRKESNWKNYTGSNKELNEDIKNGDRISKIILDFGFSKIHLTYLELKYQFIYEVLESNNWYNENISGRLFRSIFDFKNK